VKKRILNSAKKLFLEKGYNKTTLKDIVKDAETSIGNCYFYYKNKEELLVEIIKEDSERVDNIVSETISNYGITNLVNKISTIVYIHSLDFLTDKDGIKLYLMGASFPSVRVLASNKIKNHLNELNKVQDKAYDRIFTKDFLDTIDIFPILYKSIFLGLVESFHLGEIDRTVDDMLNVMVKWVLKSLGITSPEIDENLKFIKTIDIPIN
jgi:AcrR family transcriptional regulator